MKSSYKNHLVGGAFAVALLAIPAIALQTVTFDTVNTVPPPITETNAEPLFKKWQIQAYLRTKKKIRITSDKWIPRVREAQGNPAVLDKIQNHVRDEMEQTIRQSGLGIVEYHVIARAAENDPKVRREIKQLSGK
jgi:hypothetical protein